MTFIVDGTNGGFFPSWTTATRPASPAVGQMGYNTTTGLFDAYTASGWVSNLTSVNPTITSGVLTFPDATTQSTANGFVKLASGSISSSTASLDINLSSYSSYTCFKVFIRNINMASDTQIWIDKMTGSGAVAGNWYGGASREGEGEVAQVEYSGVPHWYLLGNTTQTTNDGNTYLAGLDITMMKTGTSNKWIGTANCVIRNGTGKAQQTNTGGMNIETTALWGIRYAGGANILSLSYAVYGVSLP